MKEREREEEKRRKKISKPDYGNCVENLMHI